MPAYKINKTTGNPDTLIAGGTLYADTPIGTIISSGAAYNNPPAGYLFCGGQAISRTTYAALFAVIGTSFGAGDGSTTFNVPELRGEFLRGAGTNQHAGQGNGSAPGVHQDATEIPSLELLDLDRSDTTAILNRTSESGDIVTNVDSGRSRIGYQQVTTGAFVEHPVQNAGNFTTRPTNTSVNFFIKATNIAVPSDFMSAVDEAISEVTDLIPASASPSNKLVTTADNNFKYQTLASNTDFDTVTTPGLYAIGTDNVSVSHAPIIGTFSVIVSTVANGWVQQLAIFNGDGRTFVRISIPGNWGVWEEVSFLKDVVKKFDTVITPTAGVTGLYDVVVDCLTQFVPILRAKGAGSYSGLLTCTSAWSGQYSALIYDSLVVIDGTYRFGNDIYTFRAVHNGVDLKIFADAAEEGNATVNTDVVDTSAYNNFTWRRRGKYVVASIYIGSTKSINPSSGNTVIATGFPIPFGLGTSMVPVSWASYNTMFTLQIDQSGQLVIYTRYDIQAAQIYSGQCVITYECV